MIATITFTSMAQWVVGAFSAGLVIGVLACTWYIVLRKKK